MLDLWDMYDTIQTSTVQFQVINDDSNMEVITPLSKSSIIYLRNEICFNPKREHEIWIKFGAETKNYH